MFQRQCKRCQCIGWLLSSSGGRPSPTFATKHTYCLDYVCRCRDPSVDMNSVPQIVGVPQPSGVAKNRLVHLVTVHRRIRQKRSCKQYAHMHFKQRNEHQCAIYTVSRNLHRRQLPRRPSAGLRLQDFSEPIRIGNSSRQVTGMFFHLSSCTCSMFLRRIFSMRRRGLEPG